ncbi:MAG: prepilin-type N-terminal cleavage/methylation domain-containing protein [Pirellulales bacterium]
MRDWKAESGKWKADEGWPAKEARSWLAVRRPITFRNPHSAFRIGFTLVELLVTMVILAILGTAILGASRVAMEGARKARTKTTITKLHTLLMERYESYQTRRVNINTAALTPGQLNNGPFMADVRLLGRREQMKLEMPDRWSDVLGIGVPDANPQGVPVQAPVILQTRPSLTSAYLRRYFALRTNDGSQLTGKLIRLNQGAECLYMTIMLATGDGEARNLFSQQDIGDTDGDGALEFLDGWGRAISFLRWPAGFVSDLQPLDTAGNRTPDADHDPFDPFRRDQQGVFRPNLNSYPNFIKFHITLIQDRNNDSTNPLSAYRLFPLIYSSGPDGISDIHSNPPYRVMFDPYVVTPSDEQIGTQVDDASDGQDNFLDNIHNHLMDNK